MANPQKEAQALLKKYAVVSEPVDVDAIARGEGASLIRDSLDRSISGILVRDGDQILLAVNDNHHPRRQRFTVAHELGHLVLHPGRQHTVDSTVRVNFRDDVSSMATSREEIQANAFAAELLMPAEWVQASLAKLRESSTVSPAKVAAELAEHFGVSAEAMSYRLINLGLSS